MSGSVGADIEALCTKCGDVWHVVVAKVGADIVKVQCKQCGGYHRYRRPGAVAGARKPRAAAGAASTARANAGARASSRAAAARAAAAAAAFRPDLSAPSRPYRMSESFRPGEQITHPRFGVGLVEQSSEPGKMAVLFSDGRRILAQAKPASTLGTANRMAAAAPEGEE
jgi:hypothetical protein